MIPRRQFIKNLIAFTATAPAIVRASSLMPVKSFGPVLLGVDDAITVSVQKVYWQGRIWWITGRDNIIHYEENQLQEIWMPT